MWNRSRGCRTTALWRACVLLCLLGVSVRASGDAGPASTTVFVVRHAEKAATPEDPPLSAGGEARAEALARVLADAGISAIFTSQFARARETAQPLADSLALPVTVVPLSREDLPASLAELAGRIRRRHAGQRVLVVGHSNTVPELIGALGGENVPPLGDDDYDDLFIVTAGSDGRADWIVLHYGAPSP